MAEDFGNVRIKKQKLRKGQKLGASSSEWLTRQLNDPYVALAAKTGYRSRATFKLKEINDSHKIIRAGDFVVDLGAAPGGWSQIAAQVTGRGGKVLAMDILEMKPIPDVTFILGDFMDDKIYKQLLDITGEGGVDAVISDIAPNTTGHYSTDHLRIIGLAEAALEFALKTLKPGGHFLCKIFQGAQDKPFLMEVKKHFEKAQFIKPKASRSESKEIYVLGKGRVYSQ